MHHGQTHTVVDDNSRKQQSDGGDEGVKEPGNNQGPDGILDAKGNWPEGGVTRVPVGSVRIMHAPLRGHTET